MSSKALKLENKEWLEGELAVKSASKIARELETYVNKVLRAASQHGIQCRSRSDIQKADYESGERIKPFEGKQLSQAVKDKISEAVHQKWEGLTPEQREDRVQSSKDKWNKLSEATKHDMRKKAGNAIRKASKEGSRLERFLIEELTKLGHTVLYHQKGVLSNANLEVDIWLPGLNTVVEVDGPSHFSPIWGDEVFAKTQKADQEKNGILLSIGCKVIRFRQRSKSISQAVLRHAAETIKKCLENNEKLQTVEV